MIRFLVAYVRTAKLIREHRRINWSTSYQDKRAHAKRMHRAQIELGAAAKRLGFKSKK